MVSVTQAFAVDLTGQICADQFQESFTAEFPHSRIHPRHVSGPGGKPSSASHRQPTTATPLGYGLCFSQGRCDDRSLGRPLCDNGVGIAYLFGKSISERALSLIEIAHPKFRPGWSRRPNASTIYPPVRL